MARTRTPKDKPHLKTWGPALFNVYGTRARVLSNPEVPSPPGNLTSLTGNQNPESVSPSPSPMTLPRFSPAFQILSPSRDPVTSPFFSFSFSSPSSSPKLKGRALSLGRRRPRTWRRAASAVGPTEEVLLPAAAESSSSEERAEYDWREEWYPLYLSDEVPRDAPLGLNVFDKMLVLYRDGNGSFCCFEDRCPHRFSV